MAAKLRQLHAPEEAKPMQDYLINWNAGPLGVVFGPELGADMPPVVMQLLPQPSVLKMAGVREGDLLISVNGKKTTHLGYEKVVRLLFKERLPMVLHFRSSLSELQRGASKATAEDPRTRTRTHTHPRNRTHTHTSSSARPEMSSSRLRVGSDAKHIEQKRNPNAESLSIGSDMPATSHKSKKSKKSKKRKHKREKEAKAEAEETRLRKQYSVVWERGSLGISFRAYNSKVNVPCVDFISASRGQGRGMDRVCINDVLIAINGEKTKALGVEKVLRWLHVVEKPVVLRFHASSNRVLNPASPLRPHLTGGEDTSARPRRSTMPQTQPESEPALRPPRRNNGVGQAAQRTERGCPDDREYELQPEVSRRYSNGNKGKQLVNEHEPLYQFDASNAQVKERHNLNNLPNVYARDQGRLHGDGVAGDFRREPEKLQFDLKIDAHITPHRRQQHENAACSSQPYQARLMPTRSRASSASRDDLRHQQQAGNKFAPSHGMIPTASARPRVASHDSQVSSSSQLNFDEVIGIVARATGKSVEDCEFGGVPVLKIKEGTVQSKLMCIYAKACLAKECNSSDDAASKGSQPARTPEKPLGQKTHSKYLSYTILQDDTVAPNHVPSQKNGDISSNEETVEHEEEYKVQGANDSVESKNADVPDHGLDESFAKMQNDISIHQAPVAPSPLSLVDDSASVISDTIPSVLPAPARVADDFISLKDFVVKDGSLTERRTTSSNASTLTPMQSTDDRESDEMKEQQKTPPAVNGESDEAENQQGHLSANEADKEGVVEVGCDAIVDEMADPERATGDESNQAAAGEDEQAKKLVEMARSEDEHSKIECADDLDHAVAHECENSHEDDDVSSVDSFDERDLTASVVSLDDLLALPLRGDNHSDEEHEELADDDDEGEGTNVSADKEESMNTSLGVKLDLVQEEEAGQTNDHEVEKSREEHDHDDENEEHETNDEEGLALSNSLVKELFRNNPDVRKVIKDKSAVVVLVKKTMIDEIQEILQSLQMELHFERHSIMAIGSTASPLCDSQQDWDTEGQHCSRCGATGELAELDVAGGHNKLYCQECWELFFFSEDQQSPVKRTGKTLAPLETGQPTADEDALDEALKYSFHDSSISQDDVTHAWQDLRSSDSMSSSICDSNSSSFTDGMDEFWL